MSRNLILIITIFGFWLFIYLSNIKEEQKAEDFKNNLADDGIKFTVSTTEPTYTLGDKESAKNALIQASKPTYTLGDKEGAINALNRINKPKYIFSPVSPKGEI